MAKVATFSPESPRDPAHTTLLHSTEDERNVSQIGMLLQIREQASQLLVRQEQIGSPWTVDEEAVKDARETFTLAGVRLRDLIDEQRRWGLDPNEIDIKTAAVLDLKIEESENRIQTQEKMRSPSAFYRTQLRRIEYPAGKLVWVCWLGANEPTLNDVHGFGQTPAEACQAFDAEFHKAIPPEEKPPAPTQPVQEPEFFVMPQEVLPGADTQKPAKTSKRKK
jgi:hypothetical protein